jgi:hypothetical protein
MTGNMATVASMSSVVDLQAWRRQRLTRPWPGWWGGREMATWTQAERSRRSA